MRSALTIAGSDSSAGAGIQADLKTFAAFGVYGTSAITAVTAQSTQGVVDVAALPADFVTAQIEAVAGDIAPHATKIGMLANAAIVEAVAAAIDELELPLVVLDPILASGDGRRLLDVDGEQALRLELLPRARVITPNVPEAEVLSGMRIRSLGDARDAARRIRDTGPRAVIITGGHSKGPKVIDLLLDGDDIYEFGTERVDAGGTHGTGCTYASAIAAALALGVALTDAARDAQQYVAGAIRTRVAVGRGRALLNHLWRLY
ncbi:MAG TPA: bifunctional hydroxymethylpyrimidine kinase/phosphomethylpyrimidine kinase [Vicinamibacterales bacterium]|jgi:hydroxymethylpyrimidine/phosphomethylpyrimidine kinase